mmetsp:Transcript_70934/g.154111  ORF Transcript_70934/g.154111 Transcript_70934/m.154111 type:complete len:415 (-) Transcript_70934:105-1349(-)
MIHRFLCLWTLAFYLEELPHLVHADAARQLDAHHPSLLGDPEGECTGEQCSEQDDLEVHMLQLKSTARRTGDNRSQGQQPITELATEASAPTVTLTHIPPAGRFSDEALLEAIGNATSSAKSGFAALQMSRIAESYRRATSTGGLAYFRVTTIVVVAFLILIILIWILPRHFWEVAGDEPTAVGRSPARNTAKTLAKSPVMSRNSLGRSPMPAEGNNGVGQLPSLHPKLVMPHAHTRLAIPIEPLAEREWEVDVLGLSGVPLLSVVCEQRAADSLFQISISLHSVDDVLVRIDQHMRMFGADNGSIGRLEPQDPTKDVLKDMNERPALLMQTSEPRFPDGPGKVFPDDIQLISLVPTGAGPQGQVLATVKRRPAGSLPAEHYEVVAKPGVDSVLVLACVFARLVFSESGRKTKK